MKLPRERRSGERHPQGSQTLGKNAATRIESIPAINTSAREIVPKRGSWVAKNPRPVKVAAANRSRGGDDGGTSPSSHAHQPEIGWTVYREGGVGSVTEFIIDPCSRLVTHIVVVENRIVDGRREQKEVILPLDLIDLAREGAVWLKAGADFRNLPGFDPGDYPLAPEGWKPPFPYEVGTVRWVKREIA